MMKVNSWHEAVSMRNLSDCYVVTDYSFVRYLEILVRTNRERNFERVAVTASSRNTARKRPSGEHDGVSSRAFKPP